MSEHEEVIKLLKANLDLLISVSEALKASLQIPKTENHYHYHYDYQPLRIDPAPAYPYPTYTWCTATSGGNLT